MMKKLLVVLLLLCAASGLFAANTIPWVASYNKPGNLNAYVSAGWYIWPEVSGAIELIVGEFDIATIPLDWCIMARAGFDFWTGGMDYAAAGLATLHLGMAWNVDFYASLGVAYYGPFATFPVTVASYAGASWWFTKNLGLLVESGYLGWYFWGAGLALKL